MWKVFGDNLQMAEGDFGIPLNVTVRGVTGSQTDSLKFNFKNRVNGAAILEKEYSLTENATALILSEAESNLFHVGQYVSSVDWYQNGVFMCNIIPIGVFKVVNKA